MNIHFYKYQGTGNDFVMIDNRDESFPKNNQKLVAFLCHRRFGIGADGLILLENTDNYDFRMVYYNSDGKESSMCGNGGRCTVAFAKQLGIISDKTHFIATDGEHSAQINLQNEVQLQMKNVETIQVEENYVFLNTGSPHHVQMVDNVNQMNVNAEGAKIRYGELYKDKGGSNINFVSQQNENTFNIRTYERGVEEETYSCGTGATAVAISMYHLGKTNSKEVYLRTLGGNLKVLFERKEKGYENVYLCGAATFVFEGNCEVKI
ncbi:diaminopimelate epimerase [Capnocytophaga felis]|uniref:Diaminopimelate epimerase n=1 Tax=Capnocytophaga felis TaxID=2267611 RepID=A0A5M4BB29_9FLAO|nr:diaminopimelate epimerase [Capnocytophaga felis]GET46437.1 diaminopimelate epimerase [Capnocytophaga felis]GET48326.1 diaminopimelate epimerase [Capnocytophaga felis]